MSDIDEKIAKLLRRALAVLLFLFLLYLLFQLFFDMILPFTAAFLVALLLSPLTRKLGKKTRMSRRALRVILLFFLMGLFSALLTLGIIRLFAEGRTFFLSFYENLNKVLTSLFALIDRLQDKLPLDGINTERLSALISDGLKNAMTEISSRSAAYAARLAAKLPSLLFALFIFLIALFYLTLDYDRVMHYLSSLVPPRRRPLLERLRKAFFFALNRYVRAYFLLFLITFAELYLAFVLLRVDYAILLALLTAVLDILPAVGVGIVMIPWSLFLFLNGSTGRAVALLVIYLVITLIRQIIEPHIIGAHFGVHPLASLLALYVGFRLFGILGILISPVIALVLARLLALYREKIESSRPLSSEDSPPNNAAP